MMEQVTESPPRTVAQQYADLLDRKNRLEAELEQVKRVLGEQEPGVIAYFEQAGVTAVRLDGGRSLHLLRQLHAARAKEATDDDVIAALEAAGLGDMVKEKVTWPTVSAYARECDREGRPLPAALEGKIVVHEMYKVGTRRPAVNQSDRAAAPEQGDEDR